MFPKTSYGEFIDENRAYRITSPTPPAVLRNVIVNDDGYRSEITQWGTGAITIKYPEFDVNCDVLGRGAVGFYCRDEETGEVWTPGYAPMLKDVEDFVCEHHDGWTIVSSTYDGIHASWRRFVPNRGLREIWTLTVENRSDRTRRISLVPATSLHLVGFHSPRFFDHAYGINEYVEDINGVFYTATNPNAPWKARNLVFAASVPPADYCASEKTFFGAHGGPHHPTLLLSGGPLNGIDRAIRIADTGFAALRLPYVLAPGSSATVNVVLAAVEGRKEAVEAAGILTRPDEIDREFKDMREARAQRRSNLIIKTPDAKIDAFVNHWVKLGLEYSMVKKDATRDNCQFADGLVMSDPARARKETLRILKYQYADGHPVRSWVPVDTTTYGDGPLWLVLTACGYVKFSDDKAFLEEEVPYFDGGEGTVLEHLERAVQRLDEDRGPHGLQRIRYADWNDALNIKDPEGESVFVAMAFGVVFREMAGLMRYLGDEAKAKEYDRKHADQKKLVNEVAWDEEGGYYVRAFADGGIIGGTKSEGARIFVNPQSWAILGGMVPDERLESVLGAFDEKIEMETGCPVNIPPYSVWDERIGRLSAQLPGTGENGSIYCHATAFKAAADVTVGRGDAALRCLHKIMPDYEKNPVEKSGAAPFALTSSYRTHPGLYGVAGRQWLTGTACWFMRTVVEGLLGVRRAWGGFDMRPALPPSWDRAEATVKRGNEEYRVRIERTDSGEPEVLLNGKQLDGTFVPFQATGTHEIVVRVR